ncbi:MAG: hypothetical protein JWL81_2295, partial [Verrucomicrobiales bacterium]|nr:hypothetical protein [Verrucomicrobiales bacterium]
MRAGFSGQIVTDSNVECPNPVESIRVHRDLVTARDTPSGPTDNARNQYSALSFPNFPIF